MGNHLNDREKAVLDKVVAILNFELGNGKRQISLKELNAIYKEFHNNLTLEDEARALTYESATDFLKYCMVGVFGGMVLTAVDGIAQTGANRVIDLMQKTKSSSKRGGHQNPPSHSHYRIPPSKMKPVFASSYRNRAPNPSTQPVKSYASLYDNVHQQKPPLLPVQPTDVQRPPKLQIPPTQKPSFANPSKNPWLASAADMKKIITSTFATSTIPQRPHRAADKMQHLMPSSMDGSKPSNESTKSSESNTLYTWTSSQDHAKKTTEMCKSMKGMQLNANNMHPSPAKLPELVNNHSSSTSEVQQKSAACPPSQSQVIPSPASALEKTLDDAQFADTTMNSTGTQRSNTTVLPGKRIPQLVYIPPARREKNKQVEWIGILKIVDSCGGAVYFQILKFLYFGNFKKELDMPELKKACGTKDRQDPVSALLGILIVKANKGRLLLENDRPCAAKVKNSWNALFDAILETRDERLEVTMAFLQKLHFSFDAISYFVDHIRRTKHLREIFIVSTSKAASVVVSLAPTSNTQLCAKLLQDFSDDFNGGFY